jgi:hypothetical protein
MDGSTFKAESSPYFKHRTSGITIDRHRLSEVQLIKNSFLFLQKSKKINYFRLKYQGLSIRFL